MENKPLFCELSYKQRLKQSFESGMLSKFYKFLTKTSERRLKDNARKEKNCR
jgi:hypothetical protein